MKPSILRNLLFAYLGFGILMAMIFPLYADFFVDWKQGMFSWFVIGCLIAGASIGAMNYVLLRVLLINKLKQIATLSTAISQQDLTFNCDIKSHDVIGDIINSYNQMVHTLRTLVHELKTGSQQMINSVDHICQVADVTNEGVAQQHTETQYVEQAIHNMTQTSQDVSSKAAHAADAAAHAMKEAENGKQVVEQTVSLIRSLASAVENAGSSIHKLEAESLNIGGVLDVIRGISEQTNLLALNAAIEAARAGEQGRGFAVVADEVRTLAQRTHESTIEIQTMIETLQSVSKETVEVMEQGQNQASQSVEQAAKAGKTLEEITQAISAITEMNTLINDQAGSQSGIAVELNQKMSKISQIASESKSVSETTANETRQLAQMAANLQQLVSQYKISQNG